VTGPNIPPEDRDIGDEAAELVRLSKTNVEAAVSLKLFGASYEEIARTLDYATPSHARLAVEKAIADAAGERPNLEAMRNQAEMRLEKMLKSLSGDAFAPYVMVDDPKNPGQKKRHRNENHLPYLREALKVLDRIAALRGLNAPTQLQLQAPGAAEFEDMVSRLVEMKRGAEEAQEGDIFMYQDPETGIFGDPLPVEKPVEEVPDGEAEGEPE
jgi:hypothetical protein